MATFLTYNLRDDGLLVVGSRFGTVALTDTSFDSLSSFRVGSGLAYVFLVATPIPEPAFGTRFLGLLLLGFLRVRRSRYCLLMIAD